MHSNICFPSVIIFRTSVPSLCIIFKQLTLTISKPTELIFLRILSNFELLYRRNRLKSVFVRFRICITLLLYKVLYCWRGEENTSNTRITCHFMNLITYYSLVCWVINTSVSQKCDSHNYRSIISLQNILLIYYTMRCMIIPKIIWNYGHVMVENYVRQHYTRVCIIFECIQIITIHI